MANRRPQGGGRRMDFGRNDRGKNFGRSGVSPWQGGGPGGSLPNLLPLAGGSTEATLALASNIINLLQPRQNPVPSLLDMPIRRDFGPNVGRYDRGYGPNRMGNQGNFRRTGNYNRAGERINANRKPFRPNDGQRQQNKSSPKKEADSKAKPVKESDPEVKQENDVVKTELSDVPDEVKKDAPKTRYDDINPQLLKCHICNKSMWDGRSFENHLSGRAHAIMMQKTAESYALTADTMRQEFKIREMKRTRKTGQQPARDFYCAMCDMYAADGAFHRTTIGHRRLKKYLHPTCTSCHKEMPTRIELDEHRLTAEHLRTMQDKQEIITKPKPEVMVISTLDMEQLYLREDRQRRRRGEHNDNSELQDKPDEDKQATAGDDEEANKEGEEEKLTEEKNDADVVMQVKQEPGEEKKTLKPLDNDNTIVDYKDGDDLSEVTQEMYPAYSTERGVGRSFLSEFRCVQCRLCRKLLDCDETAEVHLRTWRHHQLFLRLLSFKKGGNQEQENGKRPLDKSDDCDNWKRRKTCTDEEQAAEAENGLDQQDASMNEQEQDAPQTDSIEIDPVVQAADEVEDWEQSVDEILADEKANSDSESKETEPEPEPVEVAEPAPKQVPEPAPKPVPEPEKPKEQPKVVEKPKPALAQVASPAVEKPKPTPTQVASPAVEKPKPVLAQVASPAVEKPKPAPAQLASPAVEKPKPAPAHVASPAVEKPKPVPAYVASPAMDDRPRQSPRGRGRGRGRARGRY